MDFNRVQEAWANQPDRPATRTDDELIRLLVARDRRIQLRVTVRDYLELATAVCMTVGFVWMATLVPVRWPWLGAAAVTFAVGGVFVRERLRNRRAEPHGAELRSSLQQALAETDHQIRLLGSVLWWYLLPTACVVVLILAGTILGARTEMAPEVWGRARAVFVPALAVMALITGGAFWLIWWANIRAVRQHLLPHREAIAGLIRQLSVDDEDGRQ
jgi:hypothetical protein